MGGACMTNTELLKKRMEKCGKNREELSSELGIPPFKLEKKLSRKEEFRASELQKLVNLLDLNASLANHIFFAEKRE